MTDTLERRTRVTQMLKERNGSESRQFIPANELAMKSLTSQGNTLTEEELWSEETSTTADHYDDWVRQAAYDIIKKRVQANPFIPEQVEHPHIRLHRLGEESIAKGKPSPFYLQIQHEIAKGLKLPAITSRLMATAQRRLKIAIAYKKHLTEKLARPDKVYPKGASESKGRIPYINLRQAKKEFKKGRLLHPFLESSDSVDDALKEHGLDWSAYSVTSPRKNKRKKMNN